MMGATRLALTCRSGALWQLPPGSSIPTRRAATRPVSLCPNYLAPIRWRTVIRYGPLPSGITERGASTGKSTGRTGSSCAGLGSSIPASGWWCLGHRCGMFESDPPRRDPHERERVELGLQARTASLRRQRRSPATSNGRAWVGNVASTVIPAAQPSVRAARPAIASLERRSAAPGTRAVRPIIVACGAASAAQRMCRGALSRRKCDLEKSSPEPWS